MLETEAIALLNKYLAGQCTDREKGLLESWYMQYYQQNLPELTDDLRLKLREEVWAALPIHNHDIADVPVKKLSLWPKVAAAAVLLIAAAGLFYYLPGDKPKAAQNQPVVFTNDVLPGKTGATLTLADGKKIYINEKSEGKLAEQEGVSISKTADGQIVYRVVAGKGNAAEFNTLKTANGEQVQVILPDNSKVRLNAASSIRYPSSFTGLKSRMVSLTGEGYFEVAKDQAHPFIVQSGGQEVKVLGTHFNINSYEAEGLIKTTLLEGSVRVSSLMPSSSFRAKRSDEKTLGYANSRDLSYSRDDVVLKPGQLALNSGKQLKVEPANTELETAWLNNDFYFRGESLESVMREIARWYNIKVSYTDEGIKQVPLIGQISRTKTLSAVLERIVVAGHVRFSIEGRQVTVMPEKQ